LNFNTNGGLRLLTLSYRTKVTNTELDTMNAKSFVFVSVFVTSVMASAYLKIPQALSMKDAQKYVSI